MAKLSEEKIKEICEQYVIIGTYSGTAKICGCSAATVKKYVTEGQEQKKAKAKILPPTDFATSITLTALLKKPDDWAKWFTISKEEIDELEQLRREF